MDRSNTIVVFDLDETLGHFVELGVFWDALQKKYGLYDKHHFFEVMDLFPEFIRPDIISILFYILTQKKKGNCDKIMIFTNNQGPKVWVEMITEYFDYKLNDKVFDNIIGAFKVHGKILEWCRNTDEKNVDDLCKCTNIPTNTQICFIDDQEHPLMVHSNVYYINVKPFHYSIQYKDLIERYYNNFIMNVDKKTFSSIMTSQMEMYNYEVKIKSNKEIALDKVISKQLLLHIQEFFQGKRLLKLKRKHKTVKRK